MRVLLWYAVPLIGFQTAAYKRFERCMLRRDERLGCGIADPRYPEVRAFLCDLYERQLVEWGLDGLKLDFIDCIQPVAGMALGAGDGRDIGDLDEAVDALMKEVVRRLRIRRPDLLIEFRQGYIGPLMRSFGNLFRAGDCPYDAAANRARTIAVRMLAGSSATHADMLMWSPHDAPEVAARQLLAVLFAVPQVSVLIERLTRPQRTMLAFWLGWWREHRATLLDGRLAAEEPEAGCPQVTADGADERVIAVYANRVVRLDDLPARCWLVNATARGELVVLAGGPLGRRRVVVRDCQGAIVSDAETGFAAGAHRIAVPPSGLVLIGN
jgi:alpha-galactosidase